MRSVISENNFDTNPVVWRYMCPVRADSFVRPPDKGIRVGAFRVVYASLEEFWFVAHVVRDQVQDDVHACEMRNKLWSANFYLQVQCDQISRNFNCLAKKSSLCPYFDPTLQKNMQLGHFLLWMARH